MSQMQRSDIFAKCYAVKWLKLQKLWLIDFPCVSWNVTRDTYSIYFSLLTHTIPSCIKIMVTDNLKVWFWVLTLLFILYRHDIKSSSYYLLGSTVYVCSYNAFHDPNVSKYWPLSFSFLFLTRRFQIHHSSTQFRKGLLDDDGHLNL